MCKIFQDTTPTNENYVQNYEEFSSSKLLSNQPSASVKPSIVYIEPWVKARNKKPKSMISDSKGNYDKHILLDVKKNFNLDSSCTSQIIKENEEPYL